MTANRATPAATATAGTAYTILLAISFCHLLNDLMQSLLPAIYPMLKGNFALDFGQIGLITLTYQMTGSILQPIVGIYTDRHPKPYSLVVGMGSTLAGLAVISQAGSYPMVLAGAGLLGIGSSIFHPESSRVARLASGGQHGLAQSLFQVGGNFGSSVGPLVAAFVILPNGQSAVGWFTAVALLGMTVLWQVGQWYGPRRLSAGKPKRAAIDGVVLSRRRVATAIIILIALMFSKFIYMSSFQSYYTFFLIDRFHLSIEEAQVRLFIFLGSVAVGTIAGGPIGDRIGRKYVIWGSILGVLPFTLALPYADLFWTSVLSIAIGLILSSAFSAIVVYAQELMPGRVGMVAGLFFGFAFGLGGLGAAVLGDIADVTGIEYVYKLCSFLPALGILTIFLPSLKEEKAR